jgi:ribosomal protein S18 acetylase RimI-like enzyme
MDRPVVDLRREQYAELDAFLAQRIYEFNAQATGLFDGEVFAASIKGQTGEIIAAVTGHTWGGTCQVTHLWVHESQRRKGLGVALMNAVESEAMRRGCWQVLLSTHSFQAPGFYERLGYKREASIEDYPKGHANVFYLKRLARGAGA